MDKAGRLAFEGALHRELRQWTHGRKSQECAEKIASMLGCTHLSQSKGCFVVETPDQPDPALEPNILRALLRLMHHHAPSMDIPFTNEMERIILDGMIKNNRWKTAMQTTAVAYEFATLVARFFDRGIPDSGFKLIQVRYQVLRQELQESLIAEPDGCTMHGLSTTKDVACLFFGDAWASFVFDELPPGSSLAGAIKSERPAFRAGLSERRQVSTIHELPPLDCP
jgi:hypothetical protein